MSQDTSRPFSENQWSHGEIPQRTDRDLLPSSRRSPGGDRKTLFPSYTPYRYRGSLIRQPLRVTNAHGRLEDQVDSNDEENPSSNEDSLTSRERGQKLHFPSFINPHLSGIHPSGWPFDEDLPGVAQPLSSLNNQQQRSRITLLKTYSSSSNWADSTNTAVARVSNQVLQESFFAEVVVASEPDEYVDVNPMHNVVGDRDKLPSLQFQVKHLHRHDLQESYAEHSYEGDRSPYIHIVPFRPRPSRSFSFHELRKPLWYRGDELGPHPKRPAHRGPKPDMVPIPKPAVQKLNSGGTLLDAAGFRSANTSTLTLPDLTRSFNAGVYGNLNASTPLLSTLGTLKEEASQLSRAEKPRSGNNEKRKSRWWNLKGRESKLPERESSDSKRFSIFRG